MKSQIKNKIKPSTCECVSECIDFSVNGVHKTIYVFVLNKTHKGKMMQGNMVSNHKARPYNKETFMQKQPNPIIRSWR